jgi:transposase-like protein
LPCSSGSALDIDSKLGAGLRSGVEQALSAASKSDEQSYRVDETYIKVNGQEKYLYRAEDSTGQTIDFLLTAKRDAAAKRFFRKGFTKILKLKARESQTGSGSMTNQAAKTDPAVCMQTFRQQEQACQLRKVCPTSETR